MTAELPGWITAAEAVEKYAINYSLLRQLIRTGVFTRGVFGTGTIRPPIYVRTAELAAWKSGGVIAVRPIREAYAAQAATAASEG